jgi:hypothetical protein
VRFASPAVWNAQASLSTASGSSSLPLPLLKVYNVYFCWLGVHTPRAVLQKRSLVEGPNPYLGLLYPVQELKVYGCVPLGTRSGLVTLTRTTLSGGVHACFRLAHCRYLTNSGVKIILVLDDSSAKDDAVTRVGCACLPTKLVALVTR